MKTTAKDIMSSKIIVAREDMNIEEAVKLLVNNKITGLPVVDKDGKMVGVLSEYDIIASVGGKKKLESKLFQHTINFTKDVQSVNENETLEAILDCFIHAKVRRLPVVDEKKKLVGIISRRDIMRMLYYRAKVN